MEAKKPALEVQTLEGREEECILDECLKKLLIEGTAKPNQLMSDFILRNLKELIESGVSPYLLMGNVQEKEIVKRYSLLQSLGIEIDNKTLISGLVSMWKPDMLSTIRNQIPPDKLYEAYTKYFCLDVCDDNPENCVAIFDMLIKEYGHNPMKFYWKIIAVRRPRRNLLRSHFLLRVLEAYEPRMDEGAISSTLQCYKAFGGGDINKASQSLISKVIAKGGRKRSVVIRALKIDASRIKDAEDRVRYIKCFEERLKNFEFSDEELFECILGWDKKYEYTTKTIPSNLYKVRKQYLLPGALKSEQNRKILIKAYVFSTLSEPSLHKRREIAEKIKTKMAELNIPESALQAMILEEFC